MTELETDVFKRPAFLPERATPRPSATETAPPVEVPSQDEQPAVEAASSTTDDTAVTEQNSESTKPLKPNVITPPLPYTEPSWGGLPDKFYSLEVRFLTAC